MHPLFALLAFVSLNASFQEPERQVRRELHPDGSLRVEAEFVLGKAGEEVLDGKYAAFHPDGSRAIQGRHEKDLRDGTWRWWFPAGGRLQLEGRFEQGWRSGEWKTWRMDGSVDEDESGTYTLLESRYPPMGKRKRGERRAKGELLDGVPHGRWTLWWESGQTMAEGAVRRGPQHGVWLFWHADGSLDPDWISGEYSEGRHVRALDREELPTSSEPDPSRAPVLLFEASVSDELRDRARESMAAFLSSAGAEAGEMAQAARAGRSLIALGRSADAPLLAELMRLDPANPDDARQGKRIEEQLLAALAGGATFGWREGTAAEDQAHNRRVALRWHSLISLLRLDPGCLDRETGRAAESPTAQVGLLRVRHPWLPLPLEESPKAVAATLPLLGARLDGRRGIERVAGPGAAQAIANALQWLAGHQAADGRWSCESFMSDPASGRRCDCDGGGQEIHDVGMTGLALLAFMGDGNTPRGGPRQAVVTRALDWLVAQQDPTTGLIGGRVGHGFLYDHAIATQALCDALLLTPSESLRRPAQAAVDLILGARNANAAWRYEVPPNGESDTSVTAWMISALYVAGKAELQVDSKAMQGALAWLESATDVETGRCGYDSQGSYSARIPRVNDNFPPEHTEAMTAAALYCRFLAGQEPEGSPILNKHTQLLLKTLPVWNTADHYVDYYYWFYGSQALYQMGGAAWETWSRALLRTASASQRKDGHLAGSWDPVDPWSFAGGRIYSTALMTLCLESWYRQPRLVELK